MPALSYCLRAVGLVNDLQFDPLPDVVQFINAVTLLAFQLGRNRLRIL